MSTNAPGDGMYKQGYYEILGVNRGASEEKVREAFTELALQYHPELNPGRENEAKFREIYEAYAVLKDGAKRREYDQIGQDAFSQVYAGEETCRDLSLESILYEILGVAKDASEQDINKAFTKLAIRYHFVLNLGRDNEDRLKKVYKAYTVLKDKAKRREYDRSDQDASAGGNAEDEPLSALTIEDILYDIKELAKEFGLSFDEKSIDPLGIFPLGKQVVNDAFWYGEHLLSDVLGIRIRGKVRRKH